MEIKKYPRTIELHLSNKCGHDCRICSKEHGSLNDRFCTRDYISTIAYDIQHQWDEADRKALTLQFGGDGDPFLHSEFIDYLRVFNKFCPEPKRCLYSNMELFTPEMTDIIVKEKLLHEINVRFDTIDPEIYHWHTGGNFHITTENIRYFLEKNEDIDFCIIYFPVHKYPGIVKNVLNKEPAYWDGGPPKPLVEEEQEVRKFFQDMPHKKLRFRRSGCNLWAERVDAPPDTTTPCHHLPENQGFGFTDQMLIYPNGDCGICSYADSQADFIYGNVFRRTIQEIWQGKRRMDMIDDIRKKKFHGKPGPCINPKCCRFHGC